ncbi:MAG: flagellar filament capping protein FliD [Bacillota bacterium]|nr:flagellar filament capping protein FliD [Bacillota bacterium]
MTMRINGLASGMDIDSMVNELMSAERMRTTDPLYQEKQTLEWKQEDFREVNTKLLALRTATFDLKLQGTCNARSASSSDEDVATATAGTAAIAGNYDLTVNALASGVSAASSAAMGSNETTTTLADQFTGIANTVTFTLEGKDGSQEFSFDTTTDSINTVIAEINEAELGITASYDANIDRVFFMTSDTGSDVKIDINADAEGFLRDQLKLYSGDLAEEASPVNLGTGTDADIDFNGATGLTFSSNQFTLTGINFNVKDTGSTKLTVSNDTDAVVEKITDWVTAYNNALDHIGGKLTEERYRDYPPLLDEQKEEMSETQIEQWEEKARSGMLRSDSMLTNVYNNTRQTTMDRVEGLSADNPYTSLSAIGINTNSYYEKGKLYIDETKLRAAITDNPEGVMALFTADGDTDATSGIAQRLYDQVDDSIDLVRTKAGSDSQLYDNSTLGKQIIDTDDRLDTFLDRLENIEDRYWKQFTAMETALNNMNQQSSWLMQQLGTG